MIAADVRAGFVAAGMPAELADEVLEGLAALVSTEDYRAQLRQTHLRMYVLLGDPALKIRYVPGRATMHLASAAARPPAVSQPACSSDTAVTSVR